VAGDLEQICRAFLDLDDADQDRFLRWLQDNWSFRFTRDNHQEFARPWEDPRNGFGWRQRSLLRFLDGKGGAVPERQVIEHLWPGSLSRTKAARRPRFFKTPAKKKFAGVYPRLQARLRQLELAARHRFRLLKLDWELVRGAGELRGHLELRLRQHL
jgi:hypothetical protein